MQSLTVLSAIVFLAGGFLLWCLLGFCRACINQSRFEVYFLRLLLKSKGKLVPFRNKQIAEEPKERTSHKLALFLIIASIVSAPKLVAQQDYSSGAEFEITQDTTSPQPPAQPADPEWQYGGFADIGYLHDFNYPHNHLFRSRGTTFKVNEVDLNMAAIYLKKVATETSRWGVELTGQTGTDSEVFGFSATAPNLPGWEGLRHLGPTDVSYLAPIGKGLTVQGGIFSSLIGYDSLYAKDNFTYTRPWGADFTPYLMLGVNASYPFTSKLTGTVFVVNGYWHLANANSVPSSGGQLAYKPTEHTTLKQTVLFGPHQSDTGFEFWRFLSDSIAEWKGPRLTTAFEYFVGTEKVAAPGNPRALWMSSQLPIHWVLSPRFSVTVRPEVYWDRDGRTTLFAQTVKANTTTLEYRVPFHQASAILRLEHRIDDSRGPSGGFFSDGDVAPGVPGLKPTQNLLGVGLILTFDSKFHWR
jgi:putative OmpL-like beta-barrel porin-2